MSSFNIVCSAGTNLYVQCVEADQREGGGTKARAIREDTTESKGVTLVRDFRSNCDILHLQQTRYGIYIVVIGIKFEHNLILLNLVREL